MTSEILYNVMNEEIQVCTESCGSPEEVEQSSRLWGRRVPGSQTFNPKQLHFLCPPLMVGKV